MADRQLVVLGDESFDELPFLGMENVESDTGQIISSHILETETQGGASFRYDTRHVLYGRLRPYLNKVATPDKAGRCSTELIPLLPKENCDREFLAWLLRSPSVVSFAVKYSTGERMPRADTRKLFSLFVPVPESLDEQRAIAAHLEAQMAEAQHVRRAAERQLEAAQAMRNAYLREVFDGPEARQWPRMHLGTLGDIGSGITLGRKLNNVSVRSVPYLRVANVKDAYLDLSDVYEIEATEAEIEKYRLKFGDLLLTEGGDPDKLGRGTFWEEQIAKCIHQNHIFRVRFDLNEVSPQFISAQIGSPYGKAYFLAHAKQTTGIATINQKVLAGFPVMLPSLSEQQRVVACLEARMTEAYRVRQAAERQLEAIKALPGALLREVFGGFKPPTGSEPVRGFLKGASGD